MAPSINIAIAQLRPTKANYDANLAHLDDVFAQLHTLTPRPSVLVLPETYLSGYFLEGGVREVALPAGQVYADLNDHYLATCGADAPPLDIVVGFYERYRDRFYNSALYATLGIADCRLQIADLPETQSTIYNLQSAIKHVHRKVFLPTYALFDEARFVAEGHHIAAFDTRYGRVALLICEDAWHSISGTLAALDGAQIVYVVSASPARGVSDARPTNVEHWEELLYRIADEHGVFGVLAQLVGFEGGKGFPGASFVMGPKGDIRVVGPLWD